MSLRASLIQAFPIFFLLVYTWALASALLCQVTHPDPGLFEAFGYHLLHGKILYVDIWDHKPPLIFYLNAAYLKLFGTNENAVAYGTMVFCLLQTIVFYFLSLQIFKNATTAFLATALFITIYFSAIPFGTGNYTEQYGVFFTGSGLLFLLRFLQSKNEKPLWISGLCYGIAWWFKEPFLFSVIPVFVFLLVQFFRKKIPFSNALFFGIACVIPGLLICNFMALSGSWIGYKEQLLHNSNYAKYSQAGTPLWIRERDNIYGFLSMFSFSRLTLGPAILAGAALLIVPQKTRVAGMLILGQQMADYLATGISGNRFPHYYLQSIPLTIILLFAAFAMPGKLLFKKRPWLQLLLPSALCLFFIFLQKPWTSMSISPEKRFEDPIATYLKANEYHEPRSIAMVSKDIGFYLLRAGGISEQRYIVPYPYHWIPMAGKPENYRMHEDAANFVSRPPDYLIRSESWAEMFEDCGLDSFVLENYFQVANADLPNGRHVYLLRRNTAIPAERSN